MTSEIHASEPVLVSVVIATYLNDQLSFLREAVSSVLNQTHRRLELLIVVDGNIPNETGDYLDLVTKEDARVRLIHLPQNVGPALARNAGISHANGAYIAILDADDRAVPERIARQLALLEETGADLVGSQYRLIDQVGDVIGDKYVPLSPDGIRNAVYLFNPIANSTVFATAQVLKQRPYRDVEGLGPACFGEDYDLWVTLLRDGLTLRNHPEFLVEFRADPRFLSRRRGRHVFRADLRTKLRTLPLYPFYLRPWVVLAGLCVAATRLMPATLLTALYRFRNRLRFSSSS